MNSLRSLTVTVCALLAFALTGPAAAQPTEAQTNAIKSNCRSDYMAKCMSVKPGGPEAFQCLKRNEATLSAACKTAVNAIAGNSGGGAAAQQAKPAEPVQPAPPATAAATPAPAPAATPPAAPAPATATLAPVAPKPAAPKPAAAPRPALAAAPPPAAAAAPAPPPAAMPAPKLDSPREAQLIKRFCFTDFKVLCQGVRLGQGRALQCLAANAPALSPACKQAMAQASR